MKSEVQRKIEENEYKKYLAKFEKYLNLWKLDDAEWVKNRKTTWESIKDREIKEIPDMPKTEIGQKERFYLRAKPRKSDQELYIHQRMTLTPFDNIEDIRELYFNEHVSQRRHLHSELLKYASRMYRAVPEEFYRVKLISDALYCSDFLAIKEAIGFDKRLDFAVTPPRSFVIQFANEATRFLKHSKLEYIRDLKISHNQYWTGNERSFVELTIEYFLGNLEYLIRHSDGGKRTSINKMAINSIKEFCAELRAYRPNIDAPHRDIFVEKSLVKILKHDLVNEICETA